MLARHLGPSDGEPFHNPVREGLPTIGELPRRGLNRDSNFSPSKSCESTWYAVLSMITKRFVGRLYIEMETGPRRVAGTDCVPPFFAWPIRCQVVLTITH